MSKPCKLISFEQYLELFELDNKTSCGDIPEYGTPAQIG